MLKNKTTTMKQLCLLLFVFAGLNVSYAQTLDEELGFIYVKADYLLETNRYEEAITEFNKIIDQDPAYEDALYKRATAKYALAAYKGVIKDMLLSFEKVGVTPEGVLLLGEAQEASGQSSASKTMETASVLYPENRKTKKYKKEPDVVMQDNPRTGNDNEGVSKEDLKNLEDKISSILGDLIPSGEDENNDGGSSGQDTGGMSDNRTETIYDEEPEEEVYVPDDSVNEIYIDEDLTLEIKNGLGARRILKQPNILILSETSGNVAVNVCVNRNGKVTSAEFNSNMSTLNTQSLISLAVRKSKEFWFDNSDRSEMCGTIVFIISGRA